MGLFDGMKRRAAEREQRDRMGSLLVKFASEAEQATIFARADSWTNRTLKDQGIDPDDDVVKAVAVLRQTKPELGLMDATILAKRAQSKDT